MAVMRAQPDTKHPAQPIQVSHSLGTYASALDGMLQHFSRETLDVTTERQRTGEVVVLECKVDHPTGLVHRDTMPLPNRPVREPPAIVSP